MGHPPFQGWGKDPLPYALGVPFTNMLVLAHLAERKGEIEAARRFVADADMVLQCFESRAPFIQHGCQTAGQFWDWVLIPAFLGKLGDVAGPGFFLTRIDGCEFQLQQVEEDWDVDPIIQYVPPPGAGPAEPGAVITEQTGTLRQFQVFGEGVDCVREYIGKQCGEWCGGVSAAGAGGRGAVEAGGRVAEAMLRFLNLPSCGALYVADLIPEVVKCDKWIRTGCDEGGGEEGGEEGYYANSTEASAGGPDAAARLRARRDAPITANSVCHLDGVTGRMLDEYDGRAGCEPVPLFEGFNWASLVLSHFGTKTFVHYEEFMALALNYLSDGQPKIWYIVPDSVKARFFEWLAGVLGIGEIEARRKVMLKEFMPWFSLAQQFELAELGVRRVVQYAGQALITLPGVLHWTESTGVSVAEAVNFFARGVGLEETEAAVASCFDMWNAEAGVVGGARTADVIQRFQEACERFGLGRKERAA